jgi:hypothetical protein
MKTSIITLAIIVVVAFGYGSKALAQASGQVTFVVSNQQVETLGQVTVSTASGDNYLVVPGSSTDTVSITDTATSITIFGQIVPQGQQAYITLPDQTVVAVMWETQFEVVVVDKDEIN